MSEQWMAVYREVLWVFRCVLTRVVMVTVLCAFAMLSCSSLYADPSVLTRKWDDRTKQVGIIVDPLVMTVGEVRKLDLHWSRVKREGQGSRSIGSAQMVETALLDGTATKRLHAIYSKYARSKLINRPFPMTLDGVPCNYSSEENINGVKVEFALTMTPKVDSSDNSCSLLTVCSWIGESPITLKIPEGQSSLIQATFAREKEKRVLLKLTPIVRVRTPADPVDRKEK